MKNIQLKAVSVNLQSLFFINQCWREVVKRHFIVKTDLATILYYARQKTIN